MSQSDEILDNLLGEPGESYPDNRYSEHLLEQYKLYVEMADRISTRRLTASSFFLSINTAVVALTSYVAIGDSQGQFSAFCWLVAFAGMVLSYVWFRLIGSYRDLNTAKFKVIHHIEEKLPLKPYDAEWAAVERGENPTLYRPFTHVESAVPWVFLIIHAIVFLRTFPWTVLLALNPDYKGI